VAPQEHRGDAPLGAHGEQPPPPGGAAAELEAEIAREQDAELATDEQDAELATDEQDALAQLRERAAKADEYLALAQRTQADFENFRKRMTRDVLAAEARGTGRLARALLPALDNLERAIAAVDAGEDDEHDVTKGFRLVQAELAAALSRSGIEGFTPTGERFDPAEHDAVAQQPIAGTEPGTVVEVLQTGYRLNGAILRPARVIVAG